jgi:phage FluMu gp28-like protein
MYDGSTRLLVHVHLHVQPCMSRNSRKRGHFGQTAKLKGSLVTLPVEGRRQGDREANRAADIYLLSCVMHSRSSLGGALAAPKLVDKHTHTATDDEQTHRSTLF